MIYTIVPARNEGEKISRTLDMLLRTNSDMILVVVNGCTDNTLKRVSNIDSDRIQTLYFNKPLGLDVPRSIGALSAYESGASGFIFVDGDMIGNISNNINEIIFDISSNNIDMALTDCYDETHISSNAAKILLSFRRQLNLELGIYDKIAYAIPSHGPHGISKKFIETVGFKSLSTPPVSLALAVKNRLNIKVSTRIPDHVLRSTTKDSLHASRISKTMIGDCIEACSIYQDNQPRRGFDGIDFLGYHKGRRFDILDLILGSVPE
ncbi:glycosyltransferase family A protein [Wukongibacter baidiensis]|uniref:glycosyltransferase family A protein n=1 Tax=Wukongibacter baidiensis TaxID=1723361 RepID=UPI003D7F482E